MHTNTNVEYILEKRHKFTKGCDKHLILRQWLSVIILRQKFFFQGNFIKSVVLKLIAESLKLIVESLYIFLLPPFSTWLFFLTWLKDKLFFQNHRQTVFCLVFLLLFFFPLAPLLSISPSLFLGQLYKVCCLDCWKFTQYFFFLLPLDYCSPPRWKMHS